jgi:hypothetical protein
VRQRLFGVQTVSPESIEFGGLSDTHGSHDEDGSKADGGRGTGNGATEVKKSTKNRRVEFCVPSNRPS